MDTIKGALNWVDDPFPRNVGTLTEAQNTATIELLDGDQFQLMAAPVRKRIGKHDVRMLAYNGSIPGPTLRVRQGSEVAVRFTNRIDLESTVHWHGLRLDNRYDGVPEGEHHGMQPPVPTGSSFIYHLRFPDPGIYWYHPHVREDYTQELGLYGNIIVTPSEPDYWAPVNREVTLVVDDILIERGKIAKFSRRRSNRTAMGRFGNTMLVNGDTNFEMRARRGEVVRLYLTNTANVRTFNLALPGAHVKLVGGDSGRVERERFVEELLISPSERVVVDVLFESPGTIDIEHRTPSKVYRLGRVIVDDQPVEESTEAAFEQLRVCAPLADERERLNFELERDPDKVMSLVGDMGHGGAHGHHGVPPENDGIEWDDTVQLMNRMSSPKNMFWRLVDRDTGLSNHDISWSFNVGDRVKIRIVNEPDSDHPMQHPVHFHGQRFLVLSRDGTPNDNLGWKDTVLVHTGETVDILLDASNPGSWMVHCHIAEHVESGMMFTYEVLEPGAALDVLDHHSHGL
jgi:FtsP/CotA-like multicopper oxidase with cupredoxin domain